MIGRQGGKDGIDLFCGLPGGRAGSQSGKTPNKLKLQLEVFFETESIPLYRVFESIKDKAAQE